MSNIQHWMRVAFFELRWRGRSGAGVRGCKGEQVKG